MSPTKKPRIRVKADGTHVDEQGHVVEFFDGQWRRVVNGDRVGWWRFHDHYDRDGYCDNPARGY